MPAVGSLVEIHFADELIQHRRNARCPPHLSETPALDDDPHFASQPLDRIGEVGRAATPRIAVLTRQGEQGRSDRP